MVRIAKNAALQTVKSADLALGNRIPENQKYVSKIETAGSRGIKPEMQPGIIDPETNQMAALNLVYLKGYTFAEAARFLNTSVDSVKWMVVRAIRNLKQMVTA
jgi:hypothetical protein